MDDLITWLRKQILRDKAAAEAASEEPWEIEPQVDHRGRARAYAILGKHTITHRWDKVSQTSTPEPSRETIIGPGYEGGGIFQRRNANHIVRQQPRHVIARCEADLQELARHESDFAGHCPLDDEVSPCESVRIMASGYRHREGYRPEDWAP